MYSNSIVKIEACDGAIEVEPEVDPFMDISSLRSRVKVEVSEGVLAHSSADLKPELPIPPVQKDEEVHPEEFLQVKMEETDDPINSQVNFEYEPSSEEESEDSSEDDEEEEDGDEAPTGKYQGVFFKDVMKEFIKKYRPNPSLLILLKSEPSLRFLPHFGSVRCDPCYLGIRKRRLEFKGSNTISYKKGYKFPELIYKAVHDIKQHVNTMRHLHFTSNSNNQAVPNEFSDFDEPGVFTNESILELFKSKFSARSSLLRILESDMKGTQSLVYLPKQGSLRCEICYRNKVSPSSKKYDFSKEIQMKKGICLNAYEDADLDQIIVQHFNCNEHTIMVKKKNYLGSQYNPKRPKISPPNGAISTLSNPSKSSLDGSAPMEINEDTIKLIKSHLKSPLSRTTIDVLNKDKKGDRCLVYLPASKSIRCELCFRDDGVRCISIKCRGDLIREGGMKDFSGCQRGASIANHMNSQRHIQILLKEKRNGRDTKEPFPIESPGLINPLNANVKIEPEVDPFMDISSLGSRVKEEVSEGVLAHSSVDLKPELPIPPVQNEEDFYPGELFQVKMESDDQINAQVILKSEPSSGEKAEDSSEEEEEGKTPTGKYKGVFFKDVEWEEFIKKHKPNPTLLTLLKSAPSLRYLPKFGSVRCEPCYLGIRKNTGITNKRTHKLCFKIGYKLPIRNHHQSTFIINKHLITARHIQFYADFDTHNKFNVKIEPTFGSNPIEMESGQLNGADSIELPGIVIESVDIKEEKHAI